MRNPGYGEGARSGETHPYIVALQPCSNKTGGPRGAPPEADCHTTVSASSKLQQSGPSDAGDSLFEALRRRAIVPPHDAKDSSAMLRPALLAATVSSIALLTMWWVCHNGILAFQYRQLELEPTFECHQSP